MSSVIRFRTTNQRLSRADFILVERIKRFSRINEYRLLVMKTQGELQKLDPMSMTNEVLDYATDLLQDVNQHARHVAAAVEVANGESKQRKDGS